MYGDKHINDFSNLVMFFFSLDEDFNGYIFVVFSM